MKTHKRKKERLSEKKYVKKVLSVYFSVNLFIIAFFGVVAGVQYAKRGTEKVWFGETEGFIQSEDIKNFAEKIKNALYSSN